MARGELDPVVEPCQRERSSPVAEGCEFVVAVVSNYRLVGSGFGVVEYPRLVPSRNSTRLVHHSPELLDSLPLGISSGASLPYSAVNTRRLHNGHLEL